ncbi:Ig-like domain-containing protein [Photobacterium angustum]|uniref:Ig-like domain-containing protein n=1 Tax=Photobacterium angustum TaxID=661 RepID=UPI0005E0BE9F|nr:Ig-like domain-containing protein [Photobacterium angustum]KJF93581.1 chitinase [Photobacterium angustum]PSW82920.1 chitinase [Photobacterium angustum]
MQKTLLTCALAVAFSTSHAYAADCSNIAEWQADIAYNGGSQVQQDNNIYNANWWSQGNQPSSHSGPWQEWTFVDSCMSSGNQDPSVTLISPLNNAQLTAQTDITLAANASDKDGSIQHVEFFINQQSIAVVDTAPYQINWTTELGNYTITATATDNENATKTDVVNISVISASENLAPSIAISSPTSDTTIFEGDTVTITADAEDKDGSVTQVEFFVDNQLIATSSSAPFTAQWTSTAGNHQITAKATDNENSTTTSSAITLTVDNVIVGGGCGDIPTFTSGTDYLTGDLVESYNHKYRCDVAGWCSSSSDWAYKPGEGQHWTDAWTDLGICAIAPDVKITSLNAQQTVLAGTTLTIDADATDADGAIEQVSFYANEQLIDTDLIAPYSTQWLASDLGNTTIKVVAIDNEANTNEASATVTVSDQALVTSLTSPSSGSVVTLGKALTLSATATALTSDIRQVDFIINGNVVATDKTAPYSTSWTAQSAGNYTVTAIATNGNGETALSTAASVKVQEPIEAQHNLIGYWHNFVNGSGCPIRLRDISPAWDIIDIAFADNDRNSDGTVHFNLYNGDIRSSCEPLDPQQFKDDVRELRAQGKIIVLSLGGAEGTITLNNDADQANFVSSLTDIINEWGFDGLDIDLESGSNLLHGTEIQARLPVALKQIEANIGGDMYITMAPEHPYVQGGMIAYSGIWGAYIPMINELRDMLNLLHVQLYNNGGLANPYTSGVAPEGSIDMMVASVKMLVEGFELADGSQFAPLRDDQVAIGLPSGPSSANSGQAPTQNIIDALDCVTKGSSCGSVVPTKLYPNFGGVMTWSINWDVHDGFNFSGPIGDKLQQMNNQR